MKSMFTWLYELCCGANDDLPEFRDTIFGTVGLSTLVLAILFAIIFYIVLGRWRNIWHTRGHWAVTLCLSLVVGSGLAFGVAHQALGLYNGYVMLFSVMNGVLLMIFFILLSLPLKRFSIYAKRTPF